MRWRSELFIRAAPDRVFGVVADAESFNRAIPDGAGVEYLTERRSGSGTRFRATRLVKGTPRAFEQEVTEHVAGERVRMVNETAGTVWDSTFTVAPAPGGAVLTLAMDALPTGLLARLMNRLIRGTVQKALDRDLSAVKAYCEREAG